MPDYVVYGGILHSSIDLPELRAVVAGSPVPSDAGPRWSYRQSRESARTVDLTELGSEHIYGDVHARLYRFDGGYRIIVDDTGVFDVTDGGASIAGFPYEWSWPDFVRAHLMGRVMSTALHVQGVLTLHGSAVVIGGRAVVFLAPKHYGKSTLALSLTRAGCSLLSDDTVPVDVDRGMALAGVHAMRLQSDSASLLAGTRERPRTREGKEVLDHMPDLWKHETVAGLDAIYLLAPASSISDGRVVDRTPLPGAVAAASVVGHSKIAEMLGLWGAPTLLEQASSLTGKVPVYRLDVVRDFEALPGVIAQLGSWHGQDLIWDARYRDDC